MPFIEKDLPVSTVLFELNNSNNSSNRSGATAPVNAVAGMNLAGATGIGSDENMSLKHSKTISFDIEGFLVKLTTNQSEKFDES